MWIWTNLRTLGCRCILPVLVFYNLKSGCRSWYCVTIGYLVWLNQLILFQHHTNFCCCGLHGIHSMRLDHQFDMWRDHRGSGNFLYWSINGCDRCILWAPVRIRKWCLVCDVDADKILQSLIGFGREGDTMILCSPNIAEDICGCIVMTRRWLIVVLCQEWCHDTEVWMCGICEPHEGSNQWLVLGGTDVLF